MALGGQVWTCRRGSSSTGIAMSKIIFSIHPRTLPEDVTTVGEAIEWFHTEHRLMLEATARAIVEYVSASEALAVSDGYESKNNSSAGDGTVH